MKQSPVKIAKKRLQLKERGSPRLKEGRRSRWASVKLMEKPLARMASIGARGGDAQDMAECLGVPSIHRG